MASTHQKQPPPKVASSVPLVLLEDSGVFMFWLHPAADPPTSRARHIKWLNVFFIVRYAVVEYDGPILTGKLSRALMFPDGPAPGPGQLPPGRAGRPVLPAQGRRL